MVNTVAEWMGGSFTENPAIGELRGKDHAQRR
jgi:hypothetical protein